MNQQIADIALMLVLPLGITFTAILQAAAAETRSQKFFGALLAIVIVAMDCVFYFARNSYITYNCDGALLLSFASLLFLSVTYAIRSEDLATRIGHIFLAVFMFAGFLGIAYWDRPTFIPTAEYNPAEIAAENARYQDYIASFNDGTGGKALPAKAQHKKAQASSDSSNSEESQEGEAVQAFGSAEGALGRLQHYEEEANAVIERMQEITSDLDSFEPLPANISEADREIKSQQALAMSNATVSLNRKVLGLFHPHESSEAHSELIQASESLRLAAYSLYNYTLQENPDDQLVQYKQSRDQVAQMKVYLSRFQNDIQNLKSNNQPQQNEQQDQQ